MIKIKKLILRFVSLLLIGTFCVQEVSYCAPAIIVGESATPLQFILQDPTRFEAPLDFSSLKEVQQGKNNTLIIHIQDAHSNLSGQENLASTLDALMNKYGISLVLVEGSSKEATLTPLRKLASSKELCNRVAKSFLIQGKIAGEEYLNLTTEHPMKIMGIEDKALYYKSLQSYGNLAGKREEILEYLKIIQRNLEKLKQKLYPAELLNYEKQERGNTKGVESNFKELLLLAQNKKIDLKDFPNIQKLSRLQEKEKSIDFNQANLEQAALVEEIQKAGGKESLESSLKSMNQIKNSKLSALSFFENTLNMAKKNNVSVSKYQNLVLYGEYLKEFSKIDLDQVMDEFTKAEDGIYSKILINKDARLTRAIDRYIKLLDIAYHIQMSTKDFNFFQANEADFATPAYLAFINRKLADLGYFEDLIPYKNILEQGKDALIVFYDSVDKRDVAFMQNTERILKQENQKIAVLISGGYHTTHLKKLIQEKGYSYAVLTPIVTSETNQVKYEKLLLEPLNKEKKKIETTEGESQTQNKSLSRLEKDLVLKKRDDGLRVGPLLSSAARLAAFQDAVDVPVAARLAVEDDGKPVLSGAGKVSLESLPSSGENGRLTKEKIVSIKTSFPEGDLISRYQKYWSKKSIEFKGRYADPDYRDIVDGAVRRILDNAVINVETKLQNSEESNKYTYRFDYAKSGMRGYPILFVGPDEHGLSIEKPVGRVKISNDVSFDTGNASFVLDISLDPDHQGRGIYSTILKLLAEISPSGRTTTIKGDVANISTLAYLTRLAIQKKKGVISTEESRLLEMAEKYLSDGYIDTKNTSNISNEDVGLFGSFLKENNVFFTSDEIAKTKLGKSRESFGMQHSIGYGGLTGVVLFTSLYKSAARLALPDGYNVSILNDRPTADQLKKILSMLSEFNEGWNEEGVSEAIANPKSKEIVVARDPAGDIVGVATAEISKNVGELKTLYVNPEKRKLGIGKGLFFEIMGWMKEEECALIKVTDASDRGVTGRLIVEWAGQNNYSYQRIVDQYELRPPALEGLGKRNPAARLADGLNRTVNPFGSTGSSITLLRIAQAINSAGQDATLYLLYYAKLEKNDRALVRANLNEAAAKAADVFYYIFENDPLASKKAGNGAGEPIEERKSSSKLEKLLGKILEIGRDISAHGENDLQHLLGNLLKGRFSKGKTGPLADGDPSFFAGPHGPFYVIAPRIKTGDSSDNWQDALRHVAYVVPEESDKNLMTDLIRGAEKEGLVNASLAENLTGKIFTYKEFLRTRHFRFKMPIKVRLGLALQNQKPKGLQLTKHEFVDLANALTESIPGTHRVEIISDDPANLEFKVLRDKDNKSAGGELFYIKLQISSDQPYTAVSTKTKLNNNLVAKITNQSPDSINKQEFLEYFNSKLQGILGDRSIKFSNVNSAAARLAQSSNLFEDFDLIIGMFGNKAAAFNAKKFFSQPLIRVKVEVEGKKRMYRINPATGSVAMEIPWRKFWRKAEMIDPNLVRKKASSIDFYDKNVAFSVKMIQGQVSEVVVAPLRLKLIGTIEEKNKLKLVAKGRKFAAHGTGNIFTTAMIIREGFLRHSKMQQSFDPQYGNLALMGQQGGPYNPATGMFILDENFDFKKDPIVLPGQTSYSIKMDRVLAVVVDPVYVEALRRVSPEETRKKIMSYAEAAQYLSQISGRGGRRGDDLTDNNAARLAVSESFSGGLPSDTAKYSFATIFQFEGNEEDLNLYHQIIESTDSSMTLIILFPNDKSMAKMEEWLKVNRPSQQAILFNTYTPRLTRWVRDNLLIVETANGWSIVMPHRNSGSRRYAGKFSDDMGVIEDFSRLISAQADKRLSFIQTELIFEHGDILSNRNMILIGRNTINQNLRQRPGVAENQILKEFKNIFGEDKKILIVDDPFNYHLDICMTLMDDGTIFVADPSLGLHYLRRKEPFDTVEQFYRRQKISMGLPEGKKLGLEYTTELTHSYQPKIRRLVKALKKEGFRVVRMPYVLGYENDEDEGFRTAFPLATFNNILFQQGSGVTFSKFGLTKTEEAAAKLYQKKGYTIKPVEGMSLWLLSQGGIRCATQSFLSDRESSKKSWMSLLTSLLKVAGDDMSGRFALVGPFSPVNEVVSARRQNENLTKRIKGLLAMISFFNLKVKIPPSETSETMEGIIERAKTLLKNMDTQKLEEVSVDRLESDFIDIVIDWAYQDGGKNALQGYVFLQKGASFNNDLLKKLTERQIRRLRESFNGGNANGDGIETEASATLEAMDYVDRLDGMLANLPVGNTAARLADKDKAQFGPTAFDKVYEQQKDTTEAKLASRVLKNVLTVVGHAGGISTQTRKVFGKLRLIRVRSKGSSYASAQEDRTDIQLSLQDTSNTESIIGSVASEAGHAIHNSFGLNDRSRIQRGVAEAYDLLALSIVRRDLGLPWEDHVRETAVIGKALLDFLAEKNMNVDEMPPAGSEEGGRFLRQFMKFIVGKSPLAGSDFQKVLLDTAVDADYGFQHYVGSYILLRILETSGGNLDRTARRMTAALFSKGKIDFASPENFVRQLSNRKEWVSIAMDIYKNTSELSFWSLVFRFVSTFIRDRIADFEYWTALRSLKKDIQLDRLIVLKKGASGGVLAYIGEHQMHQILKNMIMALEIMSEIFSGSSVHRNLMDSYGSSFGFFVPNSEAQKFLIQNDKSQPIKIQVHQLTIPFWLKLKSWPRRVIEKPMTDYLVRSVDFMDDQVESVSAARLENFSPRQPWEMTWREFAKLAVRGKVAPHTDDEKVMTDVNKGKRLIGSMIALNEAEVEEARKRYPNLKFSPLPRVGGTDDYERGIITFFSCAVYKRDEDFQRLAGAFKKLGNINQDKEPIRFLLAEIEVGRALGYSEQDIMRYVAEMMWAEKIIAPEIWFKSIRKQFPSIWYKRAHQAIVQYAAQKNREGSSLSLNAPPSIVGPQGIQVRSTGDLTPSPSVRIVSDSIVISLGLGNYLTLRLSEEGGDIVIRESKQTSLPGKELFRKKVVGGDPLIAERSEKYEIQNGGKFILVGHENGLVSRNQFQIIKKEAEYYLVNTSSAVSIQLGGKVVQAGEEIKLSFVALPGARLADQTSALKLSEVFGARLGSDQVAEPDLPKIRDDEDLTKLFAQIYLKQRGAHSPPGEIDPLEITNISKNTAISYKVSAAKVEVVLYSINATKSQELPKEVGRIDITDEVTRSGSSGILAQPSQPPATNLLSASASDATTLWLSRQKQIEPTLKQFFDVNKEGRIKLEKPALLVSFIKQEDHMSDEELNQFIQEHRVAVDRIKNLFSRGDISYQVIIQRKGSLVSDEPTGDSTPQGDFTTAYYGPGSDEMVEKAIGHTAIVTRPYMQTPTTLNVFNHGANFAAGIIASSSKAQTSPDDAMTAVKNLTGLDSINQDGFGIMIKVPNGAQLSLFNRKRLIVPALRALAIKLYLQAQSLISQAIGGAA